MALGLSVDDWFLFLMSGGRLSGREWLELRADDPKSFKALGAAGVKFHHGLVGLLAEAMNDDVLALALQGKHEDAEDLVVSKIFSDYHADRQQRIDEAKAQREKADRLAREAAADARR